MSDELTLLNLWASPFGVRVTIALREKGLEFKYIEEDRSNKSPLLLISNPVYKQIPVLIHRGKPVIESTIIVQYIDEVWSNRAPLLPSDPYERSHARFWADYIDEKVYSLGRGVCNNYAGEDQEAAKKKLIECFKLLENELGDKPYFGGNTFGLVDVSLIPFYTWFYGLETCGNFSLSYECPTLVSWATDSLYFYFRFVTRFMI